MLRGRVVGPGDPAFTDSDYWLAMGHNAHLKSLHGPCGHPIEKSFDFANKYDAEAYQCAACKAVADEADDWRELDLDLNGVGFVAVERKPDDGRE